MKSAIKTLKTKIQGLKIELRTWSDPRNSSQRIIDECTQEIKEHEEALKKINIPVVDKSFYCQKPTDYNAKLKCKTQCGLCAIFEGKRQ